MSIENETKTNFETFYAAWTKQAEKNWKALHPSQQFLASYRRIAAFQSLKIDLLSDATPRAALQFFHEAHNDALVSHVSASLGAWRLALQSLRSFLENSLCGLYYTDHPIELRNWERGKKKIGFTDLMSYFDAHPDLDAVPAQISGLSRIKEEYQTLSLAVHASAKPFRMTDDVSTTLLWSDAKDRLGKWATREAACIIGICLLIVDLHHSKLTGTQRQGVRDALSFVFNQGVRKALKTNLAVTIHAP